jgi:hypothetical protein
MENKDTDIESEMNLIQLYTELGSTQYNIELLESNLKYLYQLKESLTTKIDSHLNRQKVSIGDEFKLTNLTD